MTLISNFVLIEPAFLRRSFGFAPQKPDLHDSIRWSEQQGLCCSQTRQANHSKKRQAEKHFLLSIFMVLKCLSKFRTSSAVMPSAFSGVCLLPPLLWAILKIWFLSQGQLQKLLTAVFGVNEMVKPPVDPLNGSGRAEWARRMRVMGLTSWSGECTGAPRTESPLCCPGWNFVLEKSLTF